MIVGAAHSEERILILLYVSAPSAQGMLIVQSTFGSFGGTVARASVNIRS